MTKEVTIFGQKLEGENQRDAVHIAVAPVFAKEKLYPGQAVDYASHWISPAKKKGVGIVDPYLTEPVFEGDQVWLFLYQNSITSLRHSWTHPEFLDYPSITNESNNANQKYTSLDWMKKYAEQYGMVTQEMVDHGTYFNDYGDYLNHGPRFEGEVVPEEFWDHWEAITGKKAENRGSFFSCSC